MDHDETNDEDRCVLEVLDASGHLTLTWDPNNEAETAKARVEVERLRAAGYSFFTVFGANGKDEISAGNGKLFVERLDFSDSASGPEIPSAPTRIPAPSVPSSAPAAAAADPDLATWLREARKKKGLAQAVLAKHLKSNQGTISLWERGRGAPNAAQIAKLVEILGVPVPSALSASSTPESTPAPAPAPEQRRGGRAVAIRPMAGG